MNWIKFLNINFYILTIFLFFPVNASANSNDYNATCASTIGEIAQFNCIKDAVTIKIDKKRNSIACPSSVIWKKGKINCVSGSRLGAIKGKNYIAMFLCRKYFTNLKDEQFSDIALIQHDLRTGNTCWFQSRIQKSANDSPLAGESVPSPSSEAGAKFWQLGAVKKSQCVSCHSASPFIYSPYLEDAAKPFLPYWNPLGPYVPNFQNIFGDIEMPLRFKMKSGACAGCHFFANSGIRLVRDVIKHRSMPFGNTLKNHEQLWKLSYMNDILNVLHCYNNEGDIENLCEPVQ